MVGPPTCASSSHNPFLFLPNPFLSQPPPQTPPPPFPFDTTPSLNLPPVTPVPQYVCTTLESSSSSCGSALPLPASCSHGLETGCDKPGTRNQEQDSFPHIVPVSYGDGERLLPQWESFSFQIKEKLARAQRDFGRESVFLKILFKATFSSNTLTPFDIKDLLSCLLESPEYMLWEGTWK